MVVEDAAVAVLPEVLLPVQVAVAAVVHLLQRHQRIPVESMVPAAACVSRAA